MTIAEDVNQLVWHDWRSHLRHCITTVEQLRHWINVTEREAQAIQSCAGKYCWSITPYYASLMDKQDDQCPIRQQAVPSLGEFTLFEGADPDPVGDWSYRKTNRVIYKYPIASLCW